jgi:hypothetical protein
MGRRDHSKRRTGVVERLMQFLHGGRPWIDDMSRSELERLVAEAEVRSELRQRLQGCHSREELARLARSLGYGITTGDMQRAEAEQGLEGKFGQLLP